jgi:surface antigen
MLLTLLVGGLAACGGAPAVQGVAHPTGASSRHPGVYCAPFARELSGLPLYGDADTWWGQAAGRYDRGSDPVPGAVLVFKRSSRLPSGHVAVVSRVLGARQIQVTQANWIPGQVDQDQLVVDVSNRNDWSAVRVWYTPEAHLGGYAYPAYGFIVPPRPARHDELANATEAAARYALDTRGRPAPRARYVSK